MVEAAKADPIWFLPHRFWAATRNMTKEHADRLLGRWCWETRQLGGIA